MDEQTKTELVTADEITPAELPESISAQSQPLPQGAPGASETHSLGAEGSTPSPALWDGANPPRPGIDADAAGVTYDPARHIPHLHRHSRRWMPRGGRKAKVPATGTPGPAAPASLRPPPKSFIPDTVPPPVEKQEPSPTAATDERHSVDHSTDAGEVLATGAQFVAGLVFDAPEECTASAAQHRHMVSATAAWLRSREVKIAAGAGIVLMFVAWLLSTMRKPKVHNKLRTWLGHTDTDSRNITPGAAAPSSPSPDDSTSPVVDISPAVPDTIRPIGAPRVIPPLAKYNQ